MPFSLRHSSETNIADLVFDGTVTADDVRESTAQCIALQRQFSVLNFIISVDDADVFVSAAVLSSLPAREYREQEVRRSTRVAILRPRHPKALEAAAIYEQACRALHWNVRICAGREAAVEWLRAPELAP